MKMNIIQKWKFDNAILELLFSINDEAEILSFFEKFEDDEQKEILNVSDNDIHEMRASLKNKLKELDKFDIQKQ